MAKDKCIVIMDGIRHGGEEFIAVLPQPNGDMGFFYNTDALSMGMAMQMCARSFAKMINQLEEEDQSEIYSILGGPAYE